MKYGEIKTMMFRIVVVLMLLEVVMVGIGGDC